MFASDNYFVLHVLASVCVCVLVVYMREWGRMYACIECDMWCDDERETASEREKKWLETNWYLCCTKELGQWHSSNAKNRSQFPQTEPILLYLSLFVVVVSIAIPHSHIQLCYSLLLSYMSWTLTLDTHTKALKGTSIGYFLYYFFFWLLNLRRRFSNWNHEYLFTLHTTHSCLSEYILCDYQTILDYFIVHSKELNQPHIEKIHTLFFLIIYIYFFLRSFKKIGAPPSGQLWYSATGITMRHLGMRSVICGDVRKVGVWYVPCWWPSIEKCGNYMQFSIVEDG